MSLVLCLSPEIVKCYSYHTANRAPALTGHFAPHAEKSKMSEDTKIETWNSAMNYRGPYTWESWVKVLKSCVWMLVSATGEKIESA